MKNRFIHASDPFMDEETITSSPLPPKGPSFQQALSNKLDSCDFNLGKSHQAERKQNSD
jgi:hypothetical protein